MKRIRLLPIHTLTPRSKRISWHHVLIAITVVATGVATGTSYLEATGTLTVDTIWQHTPITWTRIDGTWCSATCPSAQSGATMGYDSGSAVVVLVTTDGSTWTYSHGALTKLAVTAPTTGGMLGEDWAEGTSYGADLNYMTAGNTGIASLEDPSETTAWTWATNSCTGGGCWNKGAAPTPATQGAYEPVLQSSGNSAYLAGTAWWGTDTSLYVEPTGNAPRLETYTCSTTCPTATALTGASFVYDRYVGYDILFDTLGNTWSLVFSATALTATLTELESATSTAGTCNIIGGASGVPCPQPRSAAGIAFYGSCGYVVMFGGKTSGGTPLSDTWKFQAGSWSYQGSSSTLQPVTSPPASYGMAMASDFTDGSVVLFGGTLSGGTTDSEAWSLSPSTGGCP